MIQHTPRRRPKRQQPHAGSHEAAVLEALLRGDGLVGADTHALLAGVLGPDQSTVGLPNGGLMGSRDLDSACCTLKSLHRWQVIRRSRWVPSRLGRRIRVVEHRLHIADLYARERAAALAEYYSKEPDAMPFGW